MRAKHNSQKGAVSIFIVVFAAILIVTITVAFVRIMITGQEQATANDLSTSALDSAYAGVEDAKRLLVLHEKCLTDPAPAASCSTINTAMTLDVNGSTKCTTLSDSGLVAADGAEVILQTSDNDKLLDQAYTCVKITPDTKDYIASLKTDESRLVPLKSKSVFSSIEIQWYSQKNFQDAQTPGSFTDVVLDTNSILPKKSSWSIFTPALMRLQFLKAGQSGFKLTDLENNTNNASLFLRPSSVGRNQGLSFSSDSRHTVASPSILELITCVTPARGYACSAKIGLVGSVQPGDTAFLRVVPIYNTKPVTFRVCLGSCSEDDNVLFDGVQPKIDSTGRADDYFRRVESRVEFLPNNMPDIDAAVGVAGNLCKNFEVGDTVRDYVNYCTP